MFNLFLIKNFISMKRFFILAAALSLGFASCNNEVQDGPTPNPVNGKAAPVVLRISTPGAATRAAQGTQDATNPEMKLNPDDSLTVAVFTPLGMLEYAGQLELKLAEGETAVWETPLLQAVMLPTGQHYFFVFANNDNDEIKIDMLLGEDKIGEPLLEGWMKEQFGVTFTGTGDIPSIAVDNEFLLGTLWKEAVTAPAGGDQENPEYVDLEVGRLSSKIVMYTVEETPGTGSILQGKFSNPRYRLGTVANAMNYAGVMKNAAHLDPFTANREVVSAKHNAPFLHQDSLALNPATKAFNTADFVRYYNFVPVDSSANWFYATENTTALIDSEGIKAQFYGNTTYIQIETIYTPDQSEIYGFKLNTITGKYEMKTVAELNSTTGAWAGNSGDMTFWSYGSGAARVLLATEPTEQQQIDLTLTGEVFVKYNQGLNFHKFPVQDQGEMAGLYKNRVLRNHYYSYDVTGIVDLGSHTSEVDPTEPIEGETWVRLKVTVAPWDKVTNGSIIL
jgi:hypothetical protein